MNTLATSCCSALKAGVETGLLVATATIAMYTKMNGNTEALHATVIVNIKQDVVTFSFEQILLLS